MLGAGRAVRYGVGVGREGFTWSGVQTISRKAEWPDWHPPAQMIARQPYLPRFMAGGPGNPLGARAMYLGSSEYRIHGTNDPSTIGKFVSSGCIRLTNEDVTDLFSRVDVGTKVVVLPKNSSSLQAGANTGRAVAARQVTTAGLWLRPQVPRSPAVSTRSNARTFRPLPIESQRSRGMEMLRRSTRQAASGLAMALGILALAASAQAEDFFSSLFGASTRPAPCARVAPAVCNGRRFHGSTRRGPSFTPDFV